MFLDKSIKEVVDELNGRYFLPDIQREYVWLQNADEKKIEKLLTPFLGAILSALFYFGNYQKRI
ncbi:hypothetical protein HMPREF1448_00077 [Helicobacter pylori HP260AFi]|uniref:DUF262 domain-containing protein n=1 Tax=Helicobacter pylori HP260AFii TaxID=1159077 RepID=A0ABC9SBN6_HELPX|nr:hypothetical protein HMPREF1448_00077 [Helicobacter pylori HP260AFi]EMH68872.1 hypothetical protein HMPREF1449_00146 [Helicobacter pylori HP260AFii]